MASRAAPATENSREATVSLVDRLDRARSVADAVLYEGYVLYPYRRSSPKNQVRWQFGVLAPRPWVDANVTQRPGISGAVEAWYQQADCLMVAPPDATVHVLVRFLQLQAKTVEQATATTVFEPVSRLDVGTQRHLPFDEAVPHEIDVTAALSDAHGEVAHAFAVTGGMQAEMLRDAGGTLHGRVVRTQWPLAGTLRISAATLDAARRLVRLRIRTENANTDQAIAGAPRTQVLRHSLIAAHALVAIDGGTMLSLLDPPSWAQEAAKACVNEHVFPVLAGDAGTGDVVLASPILLYDHPQVAPESPGDLFDATEIDEILSLRTMTLTDEEKREARATDPRAAALVERVDAMPDEVLSRLHGVVRSLRPIEQPGGDETTAAGS